MKLKLVKVRNDIPVTDGGRIIDKNVPADSYWRSLPYKSGEMYFVRDSYFDPEEYWEVVSPQGTSSRYVGALHKEHCIVLRGPLAWWRCRHEARRPSTVAYIESLEQKRLRRRIDFERRLKNKEFQFKRQMNVMKALEKLGDI